MDAVFELEVYETDNRKAPFITWQSKLNQKTRDLITARLGRLRLGNLGDAKVIRGAKGLHELRIHQGPGYRLYFGKQGDKLIILLCGGTKGSQTGDIEKAKRYWNDYQLTQEKG